MHYALSPRLHWCCAFCIDIYSRLFHRIDRYTGTIGRETRKSRGSWIKGQCYGRKKGETVYNGRQTRKGILGGTNSPGCKDTFVSIRPRIHRCNRAETWLVARCAAPIAKNLLGRAAEMIIAPASRRKLTRVYRRNYMCISRHVTHGLKRPVSATSK